MNEDLQTAAREEIRDRLELTQQGKPANTAMNYKTVLLSGKLWAYLADLNEQAQERLDTITAQMMAVEGVTEELKRTSQMDWVQAVNSIRNRAEEIILHEMIYV